MYTRNCNSKSEVRFAVWLFQNQKATGIVKYVKKMQWKKKL